MADENRLTLGVKLRVIRKARGMSQEELADAVGVSRSTISRLERDRPVARRKKLVSAIETALGVPSGFFLSGNAPTENVLAFTAVAGALLYLTEPAGMLC